MPQHWAYTWRFQFQYGTIKIFAKYFTSEHAICRFQFHSSTIKTSCHLFNFFTPILFQFHDGTIKTKMAGGEYSYTFKFQFHDGTIKTDSHDLP